MSLNESTSTAAFNDVATLSPEATFESLSVWGLAIYPRLQSSDETWTNFSHNYSSSKTSVPMHATGKKKSNDTSRPSAFTQLLARLRQTCQWITKNWKPLTASVVGWISMLLQYLLRPVFLHTLRSWICLLPILGMFPQMCPSSSAELFPSTSKILGCPDVCAPTGIDSLSTVIKDIKNISSQVELEFVVFGLRIRDFAQQGALRDDEEIVEAASITRNSSSQIRQRLIEYHAKVMGGVTNSIIMDEELFRSLNESIASKGTITTNWGDLLFSVFGYDRTLKTTIKIFYSRMSEMVDYLKDIAESIDKIIATLEELERNVDLLSKSIKTPEERIESRLGQLRHSIWMTFGAHDELIYQLESRLEEICSMDKELDDTRRKIHALISTLQKVKTQIFVVIKDAPRPLSMMNTVMIKERIAVVKASVGLLITSWRTFQEDYGHAYQIIKNGY
ncbi:hypothetical protein M422DRAFT_72455 [Sphaerobolus stellatus SS14]|uniref:Uncharacterized protein n=1 Tax=Sphaerobolus stellatus (strain SS14) TaxID=990650 RepID=A0A0C9U4E1_SPHS4|nr:hypothetical protein M422DRAFT_72455 [Sphaerobolus stellatus SS14]